MPYINTKVTTEITHEKEEILKSKLGEAIALIGKPEAYLMLQFEENCRLWFAGSNDEDAAYVEVALLHSAPKASYEKLTEEICKILSEELSIPSDRIYVKFSETEFWGWDGRMF
ncbi:MAG: hypothetical protein IJC86_01135 [Clostridia bacterium]|nr:hypothetical protein [Clostridia bacterium]